MMNYDEAIRATGDDARRLEELYRTCQTEGAQADFTRAMEAAYSESPEDPLYAAWHFRLLPVETRRASDKPVDWKAALPIALIAGIICAILALPAFDFADGMPYVLFALPVVASVAIITYLAVAGGDRRATWRAVLIALAGGVYVTLVSVLTAGGRWVPYRILMVIHLPLLAVTAIAVKVLRARRALTDRFAFLLKAIEVCVVGGVFIIVGGIFAAITMGLFQAIGVEVSENIMRTLVAAGGGAITVLAVTTAYDPRYGPAAQRIQQGLGRIVRTMFRLLLPLALGVLVVYLFVIPFNFMVPFESREVLIVYNVMLFAVVGLLIGATPLRTDDLRERQLRWMRAGIVAVAALAVVIGLYALSATAFRTALGGITINRLAVIGWNA